MKLNDDSDDAEAVVSKHAKYSVNKRSDTVTPEVPPKDQGKKRASIDARCRTSVTVCGLPSPTALITHVCANEGIYRKGLSKSSFLRQRRKTEEDDGCKADKRIRG